MEPSVTGYVVKAADLAPILSAFTDNAAVIVPVGIALVAGFAGIRFIPKLIKTFAKG